MPNQDAIRLTNKTARALRRSARRQRMLYMACAAVLTAVLAVVSVLLGVSNLAAVPIGVGAAVLLDAVILAAGKARYLSLTGQAICTEAAARQLRGETEENVRRRQALRDLAALKEDAQQAARRDGDDDLSAEEEARPDDEEDADDPDLRPAKETRASRADAPAHRRRRQAGFQVIHHDERVK